MVWLCYLDYSVIGGKRRRLRDGFAVRVKYHILGGAFVGLVDVDNGGGSRSHTGSWPEEARGRLVGGGRGCRDGGQCQVCLVDAQVRVILQGNVRVGQDGVAGGPQQVVDLVQFLFGQRRPWTRLLYGYIL